MIVIKMTDGTRFDVKRDITFNELLELIDLYNYIYIDKNNLAIFTYHIIAVMEV